MGELVECQTARWVPPQRHDHRDSDHQSFHTIWYTSGCFNLMSIYCHLMIAVEGVPFLTLQILIWFVSHVHWNQCCCPLRCRHCARRSALNAERSQFWNAWSERLAPIFALARVLITKNWHVAFFLSLSRSKEMKKNIKQQKSLSLLDLWKKDFSPLVNFMWISSQLFGFSA